VRTSKLHIVVDAFASVEECSSCRLMLLWLMSWS